MRVGARLRAVAVWPAGIDPRRGPDDDDRRVPERDRHVPTSGTGDERLGAIALRKPRNEPLSATESSLAEHVASQAGLVLRNVRLTAELRLTIDELRASRRRFVEAQDSERRKIERNLHDGAQQQLVALGVQLSLLERIARAHAGCRAPGRGDAVAPAGAPERARRSPGPRPRDLPAAARRSRSVGRARGAGSQGCRPRPPSMPTASVGTTSRSRPPSTSARWRRYRTWRSTPVRPSAVVRLAEADGRLSFEIADDGRGFDPAAASGSGLQGMADRLDAIGGSLDIESRPGGGAIVRGRVPVARADSVDGSIAMRGSQNRLASNTESHARFGGMKPTPRGSRTSWGSLSGHAHGLLIHLRSG